MMFKKILTVGFVIFLGMAVYAFLLAPDSSEGFGEHGSASELDGTTVVMSLFVSDDNGTWGDKKSDADTESDMLDYLGIATDWISEQASDYGADTEFIYDWTEDEDLMVKTHYDGDMTDDEVCDDVVWSYIEDRIDYESLQDRYGADNVLFMVFLDTPKSLDDTSCTRTYYEGMEYPYEICYIYAHCDGDEESPASIAHEILHAYGAPDLYQADKDGDNYGITKKYVKKMENENSNDIMFRTFDEYDEMVYDDIVNDFTELDAYYVGLTDYSSVVDRWGFDESEHAYD